MRVEVALISDQVLGDLTTLSGDPSCRLEMSLHFVEILARAESGSELFMKEDLLRRDLVGVFEERKNCS